MVGFWGDDGAAWPPENDNALTWLASVRSCAAFLRGVPILAELDESALWELAQHANEVVFPAGETVIEQGDEEVNAQFYIVRSGSADVVRSTGIGSTSRVGRLVCGSYFGELGLLTNRARSASVCVGGPSPLRAYAFDALAFHRLIAEHVLVFRVIRERRRLQRSGIGMRRVSLNKLGILEGMPPEDLTYVLESALQKTEEPGTELIEQGEVGDRFYVLLNGHVEVVRDNAVMATLCPGEFFGETALLFDTPRTATVRCVDTVTTWSITRGAFQRLVGHHLLASPGAQERIMQRAQELLARLPDAPAS
ncbi:MAG: cyclic nucleotide-binding domain-containing protein [Thermoleophilia bacterium]|nr:cyclic nucleotide-binding domain-containing protein [Thermoleophilia bacterium]